MHALKVALPPECEAPRRTRAWVERGTTNYVNSNEYEDNLLIGSAQYAVYVPRIIATHWLRSEIEEAHNG